MKRIMSKYLTFFVLVVLLGGILGADSQAAGASQPGDPGSAIQGAPRDQIDPERPLRPARGRDPETVEAKLSTPELIDKAFEQGEISADERVLYLAYAVYEYASLPAQFRSLVPWWGTKVVAEVYQAAGLAGSQPSIPLSASVQAELERLLTPQDATVCDQEDGPNNVNTTDFHVNYDTIGGGLAITDYTAALTTTLNTQVTSYGWAKPPQCTGSTCTDNPWDRYPVQIATLIPGLYGYVSRVGGSYTGFIGDNPNTGASETAAYASCMVLNRDYSIFPLGALPSLQATAAHEFVHSIQLGVGDPGVPEDDMFYESTAAYMEDEVYDSVDDNYQFLYPSFTSCLGEYGGNVYSNWLFFRYAAEHTGGTNVAGGGEDVAQNYWGNVSLGQVGLGAYDNALGSKGANLNDIYHDYAIASRFMKACSTGEPYCYEEAAGYVSSEGGTPSNQGNILGTPGSYNGNLQNHYATNWVGLPVSGVYTVTLQNNSPSGILNGSIVADTPSGLQVTDLPGLVSGMGYTNLYNYAPPAGATNVVAVITNQQKTSDNPSSCTLANYTLGLDQVPVTPTGIPSYLPIVLKNEPTLSGFVTDGGIPVPDEAVFLRYYDGFAWNTIDSVFTNANGYYAFTDLPELGADQAYYVRWDNLFDNPYRLWTWRCNEIDSTSPPEDNSCSFDLKDIPLGSPASGSTVTLPRTFSWTPRGIGGDSYELILFAPPADPPIFETYPPLGYVGSYNLTFRPAGFDINTLYGWTAGVYTNEGWGEANFYKEVTFSSLSPGPRITGQVTQNGAAVAGTPVYLRYWDGISPVWVTFATAYTNPSGGYTFSSAPLLTTGQYVYVRWDNGTSNPSRLYGWWCYQISDVSYLREYTCNFDLMNISLVSPPSGWSVPLPNTFTWSPRGFSSDKYEFDLYHSTGSPYFYSPLLGTAGGYTLTALPPGFGTWTEYRWDVWVYTDYDGYGSSYYYRNVTFTGSGGPRQLPTLQTRKESPPDNQPITP
jgi:hypothetical protein